MSTVLSIHNDARSLLNDTFADIFTDAILLPFTKKAYQELQDELALNGIEIVVNDQLEINLASPTTVVSPGVTQFLMPLELWERPQTGNASQFVLMEEKDWEPNLVATDELRFWRWRDNEIKTPGALSNRTVRIKYLKIDPNILVTGYDIPIANSAVYLAARTAAIAAFSVGVNPEFGAALQVDASTRLTKLVQIAVKRNQQLGTRRQPNRSFS